MWDSWSIDEGLINAILYLRFPLTGGLGFYTMGVPTNGIQPNLITQLPSRIYGANFISVIGGAVLTTSIASKGTGYAINDTGTIYNASGTPATYTVNSVNGTGGVLTYTISNAGTGFLPAQYSTNSSTGTGSGLLFNVLTVSTPGQNRNPLKIVDEQVYFGHSDLSASGMTPDEIYFDWGYDANGFTRVYLYPLFNGVNNATLELQADTFGNWALATNYNIPSGYADAINYALAFRLIPQFGVSVQQSIIETITPLAQKAELRLRTANKVNRQLPEGAEMLEKPQVKA